MLDRITHCICAIMNYFFRMLQLIPNFCNWQDDVWQHQAQFRKFPRIPTCARFSIIFSVCNKNINLQGVFWWRFPQVFCSWGFLAFFLFPTFASIQIFHYSIIVCTIQFKYIISKIHIYTIKGCRWAGN
jgi:hypothetical protein